LLLDVVRTGEEGRTLRPPVAFSQVGMLKYVWRKKENTPEEDRLIRALERSMGEVGRLGEVRGKVEILAGRVSRKGGSLTFQDDLPGLLGSILLTRATPN